MSVPNGLALGGDAADVQHLLFSVKQKNKVLGLTTEQLGLFMNLFVSRICVEIFCKVVNTVSTSPKSINEVLTYLDNLLFLLFCEVLLSPILSADI